jgi:hypothetical protein
MNIDHDIIFSKSIKLMQFLKNFATLLGRQMEAHLNNVEARAGDTHL